MKISSLLILLGVAVANVTAAKCSDEEIKKYHPLVKNPDLKQCKKDYNFKELMVPERLAKICASKACHNTMRAFHNVSPGNCDLDVGFQVNMHVVVSNFQRACGSLKPSLRSLQEE